MRNNKWMKTGLWMLCALLICTFALAGCVNTSTIKKTDKTYEFSNPTKTTAQPDAGFVIDGVLDEQQYKNCNWLKLQNTQGAGVDIAMTSFYGEKGIYIVYDVSDNSPIYVNPDRATYLNSCIEMYLASSNATSMASNEVFEIDMLPTGELSIRQRTGKDNWVNAATTDETMAVLGATTKDGPVNTEECKGYNLELFIPWEYLDKVGLDASQMKQSFIYINPVHITAYNYEGTESGTDRYWYSFATQLGSDGWNDIAQFFRFGKDGAIGTVPVELEQGAHYVITGNSTTIPGMLTAVQIKPEAGHTLTSIQVNGEEYIQRVSYNQDGSVTLTLRGQKDGLKVSADTEEVASGNKTLSGTVQVNKLGGDTLEGVSLSCKGPWGEKPVEFDKNGNFVLTDLEPGYYVLSAIKKGYTAINRGIYLDRDIETVLTLEYVMFQAESGYNWILDEQNNGILNRFGGSGKIISTDSYTKFGVEATFRYDTELAKMSDGDTFLQQRSGIQIRFSNNKYWRVDLMKENGVYKVQYATHNESTLFTWKTVHVLTEEQIAKYQSEEGIKLSILRDGRVAWVLLDGEPVAIEVLDEEYSKLKAQIGFEGWVANQEIDEMEYNIVKDFKQNLWDFHFTTNTQWDISKQLKNSITLPNGGTATAKFYRTYKDFDVTLSNVKEHDTTGKKPGRTDLLLEFDTNGDGKADKSVSFGIVCTNAADKSCWVQTLGNKDNHIGATRVQGLYKLTAEEAQKYLSGKGVQLRVVRKGTDVYVFVDGEEVAIWDLTQNGSGVTANTPAQLSIRHYDATGKNVKVDFAITGTVSNIEINKIFKDNEKWDLSKQGVGIVSLPGGGTDTSLQMLKKYQNIDLTVTAKEYDTTGQKPGRTDILFEFDLNNDGSMDKNVSFGIVKLSDGRCVVQTLGWQKNYIPANRINELYELDYAQTQKYLGEGVALRVVRYGTNVYVYVDDTQVTVFDLTQNDSGVTADVKATVGLRHYEAVADAVVIPFKVAEPEAEPEVVPLPESVFKPNSKWDLSQQNQGTVTVNGVEALKGVAFLPGGGATDKPLQFAGMYQNVDLTLNARDYADSSTASRTEFGFEFDVDGDGKIDTAKGDQTVTFGIAEGNRIQTRAGTLLNWKTPYDLSDAEKAQLTITAEEVAEGNEDGLDLRVIRYGTMIYLFVENRQVAVCDLTKCAKDGGDTASGITADTKMFIYLRHYDDTRTAGVKIPFTISTEVAPVQITISAANGTASAAAKVNHYVNNGRTTTTSNTHFAGEKVTLTMTPSVADYTVDKALVNGKNVTADVKAAANGTYEYILQATETTYTVSVEFGAHPFKSNYDASIWDISGQDNGLVVLPNGGGGTNAPLEFSKKFTDVDLSLTVRDYPNGDKAEDARTDVEFLFDNGETVTFGVVKTSNEYRIQNRAGTLLSWKTPYFITDQALIDAYVVTEEELESGNLGGLDFRIVRYGTEFYLYLNGTMVKGYDFSYKIAANTPVTVKLRHYDDAGFKVEIPFTVNEDVSIDDPRLFANKEAVKNYAYSFAVIPDIQIVTENDVKNGQNNLAKLFDWIVANKESKKIQYVFGLGDITDNNNQAEWTLAKNQHAKLSAAGIPYSVVRGNHDLPGFGGGIATDAFTAYMGTDAYRAQFEGFYESSNVANAWRTLTVGEVKYLMLTLDYGASDAVLNWASGIIEAHPYHNVIITTHAYLFRDGTTLDEGDIVPPSTSGGSNDGDEMWEKLVSKHENIILVMCGHDPSESIVVNRSQGDNGNTVTAMLIDAQDVEAQEGSMGMVAMLYFSEDGKKVQVEYYSTAKQKYFMSSNQFSAELDVVEEPVVYGTGYKPVSGSLVTSGTYTAFPRTIEITFSTTNVANRTILWGNCDGKALDYINLELEKDSGLVYLNTTLNGTTYRHSFTGVQKAITATGDPVRLTLVIEDKQICLYINGELKQARTVTNGGDGAKSMDAMLAAAAQAKLSASGWAIGDDLRGLYRLNGTIYSLAVWSDARTAQEVANSSISQLGTAGYQDNLLAAYDFQAARKITAEDAFHKDLSGNGKDLAGNLNVTVSNTAPSAQP